MTVSNNIYRQFFLMSLSLCYRYQVLQVIIIIRTTSVLILPLRFYETIACKLCFVVLVVQYCGKNESTVLIY